MGDTECLILAGLVIRVLVGVRRFMSYAPHHPDCQEAISRVTLGALKDLGYPVDMSKAEYYRFFRDTIVKNPFDPERGGRPSPKPVVSTAHWCGASREVVELVRY